MLEEMLCCIATVQLLATNSRDLAGFLTTVRGRKVFDKRGIAGTVEEAVAKRWGLGSKVNAFFGA